MAQQWFTPQSRLRKAEERNDRIARNMQELPREPSAVEDTLGAAEEILPFYLAGPAVSLAGKGINWAKPYVGRAAQGLGNKFMQTVKDTPIEETIDFGRRAFTTGATAIAASPAAKKIMDKLSQWGGPSSGKTISKTDEWWGEALKRAEKDLNNPLFTAKSMRWLAAHNNRPPAWMRTARQQWDAMIDDLVNLAKSGDSPWVSAEIQTLRSMDVLSHRTYIQLLKRAGLKPAEIARWPFIGYRAGDYGYTAKEAQKMMKIEVSEGLKPWGQDMVSYSAPIKISREQPDEELSKRFARYMRSLGY